jgi:hypothetical protein
MKNAGIKYKYIEVHYMLDQRVKMWMNFYMYTSSMEINNINYLKLKFESNFEINRKISLW